MPRPKKTQAGQGDANSNHHSGEDPEPMDVNDNGPDDPDPDPDSPSFGQSAEELAKRREIRHQYRNIQTNLDDHQTEYEAPASTGLHEQLVKADELFNEVKHTREAAMDSAIVYKIAEASKRQAQALHTDFLQFEPIGFAEKILDFLEQYQEGDETVTHVSREAWEKLGDAVQPFFQRSPPLHFMFGSFMRAPPTPKIRKPKPPKEKEDPRSNQAVAPKTITGKDKRKTTETTTEEVDQVHNILLAYYRNWGKHPICYFEFVVNPQSFGQTIENIFHVSFLVKDGLARIFLDEDKLPVIEPIEKQEGQEVQDERRHQVIMTMTKKEWLEIVETFAIGKPIIPTRKHVDTGEPLSGNADSDVENREEPPPSTSGGNNKQSRRKKTDKPSGKRGR